MSNKVKGLGKGLDALIRETRSVAAPESAPTVVKLEDIVPNPDQPRKHFSEKAIDELAASIASQGLLQPILVRPLVSQPNKYEIVAGERRWRASQKAGLTKVAVVIRTFTTQETLLAALVENLQREDLNPIEEALGIQVLKEEFSLSQEDLAAKIGKNRSTVANTLRLLSLPVEVQEALAQGQIFAGHARSILAIDNEQAQTALKNVIVAKGLSVREAEGLAVTWKETGGFDIATMEENVVTKKGMAKQKAKPQSAILFQIQDRIASTLSMPVKVTGNESKGKVTISFSSKDELHKILSQIGAGAV